MSKKVEPSILLDADVVRHFLTGNKIFFLPKIFPNRLVMLDKVKEELCRSTSIKRQVENFLQMSKIPIEDFPKDVQIIKEYALLKKSFGDGESACMAVAKFQKKYIASSNLNDIKKYCEQNQIVYYTTLDILLEAYYKKIMTLAECDLFIYLRN